MTLRLVAMAGHRLVKGQFAGIPEDDILQQARVAIEAVAEGHGGPRAAARLAAVRIVLSKAFLPLLTDQQLLYELKRRTARTRLGGALNGLDAPRVRANVAFTPTKTIAYLWVSNREAGQPGVSLTWPIVAP